MSFAHSPQIVTNGLVLALDAGNTKSHVSGSTAWLDKSGNGYNGTLTNGPTFNSGSGGSIVFDGVDDYVNFGNILNPSLLNNNFTIEVWFNVSQYLSGVYQQRLVSYWDWYTFMFQGNSELRFEILAGGAYKAVSTSLPSTNTWNQLVAIYNGSQLKIYKNGVLSNSANATGNIGTTNYIFNIGAFQNEVAYRISGRMSVVRVYNKELTATEILQNFNANRGRFGI